MWTQYQQIYIITALSSCAELATFACNVIDARYLSKDFLVEFIELLRQHPSLWKFKSKKTKTQKEAYVH
jgi:hypothetical protein